MSNIPPRPKADKAMILAACTVVVEKINGDAETIAHGIDRIVDWSNTSRGGRQFDMVDLIARTNSQKSCSSAYGLCE